MYPLVLVSVMTLGIALERAAFLYGPRTAVEIVLARLRRALANGDVGGAIAVAVPLSAGPLGRLALAGLRESLQPVPRIEAAVAGAFLLEAPRLRRRIDGLRVCAQIATLFGLYGTVTGLQCGFGCSVGNSDASSRATMLARGLSEAMNCTAGGLGVSILAIATYWILAARAELLRAELSLAALAIVNALREHRPRLRWLDERAPLERPTYREAA